MNKKEIEKWSQNLTRGLVEIGTNKIPKTLKDAIKDLEGKVAVTIHSDAEMPYIGKVSFVGDNEYMYSMKDTNNQINYYNFDTLKHVFSLYSTVRP